MLSKLNASFGKWFCWINDQWIKRFVNDDKDIIVRLVDSIKSQCSYCTNVRVFMLGVSTLAPFWLALMLILLVILFAWGEKKYMCLEVSKEKTKQEERR